MCGRKAAHPFKMMKIFNVDMDNTVIYSYKHDIGKEKSCAEIYQGREISFITHKTRDLLREIADRILVVPTTTRTIEQYNRIRLGLKEIPYALVCNGGVLLRNGVEDKQWYEKSLAMIQESAGELRKGMELLEADENRCFEVRNIQELFIFTKSNEPEKSVRRLSQILNLELVDVFHNGIKVYIVPKNLSKGHAVQRLREMLDAELVIAAGDSEFDISMLECADIAIAPEKLEVKAAKGRLVRIEEEVLFSEEVMEFVMKACQV